MPRRDDDDYEKESDEYERPARRKRDDDDDDEPPRRKATARRDDDDDEPPRRKATARRDDDDEDEPPRRKATSRRDDDDEDERPARRRARDDDDDDEPRARRKRDDDDEDERPARRRSRDDEDDEPRSRRNRDDDEDERPARRRSRDDDDDDDRGSRRPATKAKGGWEAGQKVADSASTFAKRLEVTPDDTLIKFLDDAPYVSYRQHWLQELKKKSYTCLEGFDDKGCPLCAAGDKASAKFSFNVAVVEPGLDPVLRSWDVGVTLYEILKKHHENERSGPLSKHYWVVSRPKKSNTTSINLVKERDLPEWKIKEDYETDFREVKKVKYDASILDIPTRKALREIVDELRS